MAASYYRGAHGVAIVFDLTSELSFKAVPSWLKEISEHTTVSVKRILIGNKSDLEDEREVDTEMAREFAESEGMTYIETSAKNADNVNEAFLSMTREIFDTVGTGSTALRNDVVKPCTLDGKNVQKKNESCC
jgi:Ras-related protein Rab-1A